MSYLQRRVICRAGVSSGACSVFEVCSCVLLISHHLAFAVFRTTTGHIWCLQWSTRETNFILKFFTDLRPVVVLCSCLDSFIMTYVRTTMDPLHAYLVCEIQPYSAHYFLKPTCRNQLLKIIMLWGHEGKASETAFRCVTSL